MDHFTLNNLKTYYETLGISQGKKDFAIFWGHGWGQTYTSLLPLAKTLQKQSSHILFDFPGFGQSEMPSTPWGTLDYAHHFAKWLKELPYKKKIWVGHSFGCRIGVQIASHYPDLLDGLVLIAGAGLPRDISLIEKIHRKTKIYTYKSLKKLIPFGLQEEWLKSKFGSADYKNAGSLRDTFVKVVTENLSEKSKKISCPTLLIYGSNDTETPPDIGNKYNKLIPQSELHILLNLDHYSILTQGKHQVIHLMNKFIGDIF